MQGIAIFTCPTHFPKSSLTSNWFENNSLLSIPVMVVEIIKHYKGTLQEDENNPNMHHAHRVISRDLVVT